MSESLDTTLATEKERKGVRKMKDTGQYAVYENFPLLPTHPTLWTHKKLHGNCSTGDLLQCHTRGTNAELYRK